MPALPPHIPDLDPIDPRLWRDPDFQARYRALLDRIAEVQEADSFMAYATQHHLFAELEDMLEAAQAAYANGYPTWFPVWQDWRERSQSLQGEMHPMRIRHLETQLEKAQQLLESDQFSVQASAGDILKNLDAFAGRAREEYQDWQKALMGWRQRLKSIMEQVWAEDYAPLKAAYIAGKAELEAPDTFPTVDLAPDEVAIEAAVNRKQADLLSLAEAVPEKGPLREEWTHLQTHYEPRTRFEALEKLVRTQRRKRLWRRVALATIVLAASGAGLWWGPQRYQSWQAEKIWKDIQAQPSVEAYQSYIREHPGGAYTRQADSLLRAMPTGVLDSYTDPTGRVMRYEGALKALVPNGKGQATYADGSRFEGYWEEGLPDSSGIWLGADDSRYEGEWNAGQKQGQGVYAAPWFGSYTGGWQGDKPHGQGTRIWPDSGSYSGSWLMGARQGQGNYEHPDGTRYVGGWQEDAFHGVGSFTDSTGAIYRGTWVGGQRAGKGQQSWPDGRLFQGDWRQDKRWGQGALTWQQGGRFQGTWEADTIQGWGTMETRFRSTLDGYWSGREAKVVLQDGAGAVILRGKMINGGLEVHSGG